MSGLPGSYIKKHHGDMKAAWNDYNSKHSGGGGGSKKHHSGGGGAATATRPGGSDLRTTVKSRLVSEIDPSTLGAILYGMFMELEAPMVMDTQDVLPAVMGARLQTQATAIQSDEKAQWLNRYREEIMIGRESVRTGAMGKVLLVLGVTPAKGGQHYTQAIRRAQLGGGGPVLASSGGGFQVPFDFATRVTSAFGVVRPDGTYHRGVDLAAPAGSPVRAPWAAKVGKVWHEDEGGNIVRLQLQRPDGGYADEITDADDSGLVMQFLHLQESKVKEGDIVAAGEVIALSGNTGSKSDGPHLHIMAEFIADKPWYGLDSNSRAFVDPSALYGGIDALAAGGSQVPWAGNQAMAALVEPRGGGQSVLGPVLNMFGGGNGGQQPTTVTITNSGSMVIGGGTAVTTNIKAVLPLGEAFRGGTGDGGLSDAPVPDALRGVASQVMGMGGSVLQGIGNLAGQFFGKLLSPQGITQVVHLGGAAASGLGVLAGAVGPLVPLAAPFLAAIPYVGPGLAAAAGIAGPVLAIGGPVLSGLGGVSNVLTSDGAKPVLQGMQGFMNNAPQTIQQVLDMGRGGRRTFA